MIYEVSPSIKQDKMNIQGKEDEGFFHKCSSNFRNVINYIRNFVTNQYLRTKNWKHNPILISKDESVCKFQEKSKKEEIIKKLNEIVQLLKDEGTSSNIKESSTLSNNSHGFLRKKILSS